MKDREERGQFMPAVVSLLTKFRIVLLASQVQGRFEKVRRKSQYIAEE